MDNEKILKLKEGKPLLRDKIFCIYLLFLLILFPIYIKKFNSINFNYQCIFIYSLIIPRLSLDNFNILFHSISIIILITLFFKRKIYE